MGVEAFIVYYGVRYAVEDESETAMLEYSRSRAMNDGSPIDGLDADRWHPNVRAAVSAGLDWTWGYTQEETHYLHIGKEVGRLGWEHAGDVAVPTEEMDAAMVETSGSLDAAGIN